MSLPEAASISESADDRETGIEASASDTVETDAAAVDVEHTDHTEAEAIEADAVVIAAAATAPALPEQEKRTVELAVLAADPVFDDTAAAEVERIEDTETEPAGAIAPDAAEATELGAPAEQQEFAAGTDIVETGIAEPSPLEPDAGEIITVAADEIAPAAAEPEKPCEREILVRRRWQETGIRMWNPRVHGAGQSALRIQGRVALLPPEPGETMPRYDTLEFRLVEGLIVCEGFKVEPPEPARQRSFAATGRG